MSKSIRSVIALLLGVLIFVGFPLVDWGLSDVQGFLNQPARLAYVMLVILLEIIVVIKFPKVGRDSGQGKKSVRRQRWTVLVMQILSLAIVVFRPMLIIKTRPRQAMVKQFAASVWCYLRLALSP